MSAQPPQAPVLSVRLETPAGATTRTCSFGGDGFLVDEDGVRSHVAVDQVVDVVTREVASSASEDDVTIAAVVTCAGQVFVHALARRRDGDWIDLRHALDPVATTWEDVRAALVGATVTLMTADGAHHADEAAALR